MNGRARTRRALAGLAVSLALAGCAAGASPVPSSTTPAPSAAASSSSSPVSSPTADASPTPAPTPTVTSTAGTATCNAPDPGTATNVSDGYRELRGGAVVCTVTSGDPRVRGTETGSPWNRDMWGSSAGVATVQWGTIRLENPGGAWVGAGSGVYSSDRGELVVSWYKGTGGYAGLGYFEMRSGMEPNNVRGMIFPGDPPKLTGIPSVTGPIPSPNVEVIPTPYPAPTPKALAVGPVTVVEGSSGYTVVDIGANLFAGLDMVNDPRVSGSYMAPSWTLNFLGATGDSLGFGTQWGPSRLENAGGSWQGVGSGIYDAGGDVIAIWYKGSGSYAGLAYFELLGRPDLFDPTRAVDRYGVFGQVFPGDPPTP